ncbi:BnaA09g53420D [Brassica napus]|uniref:(rape) hypothetical protein n=1 Tax=Brassica napus TaxID=3708 RepID=A0A078ILY6_BRANA|nr:unnamed protein product [Brassica napus]CDY52070.1 BnaA09g53420D [Brassica napus]
MDIDRFLQQRDPLIPSSPAFVFRSTNVLEVPSAADPIHALLSNREIAHDVTTLVYSQSIPIDTPIMESTPSNIINNEVLESIVVDPMTTTVPNHCALESASHFTVLGDGTEVEIEPSSSFRLTRGGNESKPPIKHRNME